MNRLELVELINSRKVKDICVYCDVIGNDISIAFNKESVRARLDKCISNVIVLHIDDKKVLRLCIDLLVNDSDKDTITFSNEKYINCDSASSELTIIFEEVSNND